MAYGDDAAFQAWLVANGYSLPDGASSPAVLRQRGSVYIDATYEQRFTGERTSSTQERAWPRSDASLFGTRLANTVVPQQVIDASYMAAYFDAAGTLVLSSTVDPAKRVKRQKVDTIEREFFEPGSDFYAPNAATNSLIDGILGPLIGANAPLPAILVV